jgi:hypothetical protein
MAWPGRVTDGQTVVSSTQITRRSDRNTFSAQNTQLPDVTLRLPAFGTPRYITSDGNVLTVWDHNARNGSQTQTGTFFWNTFPTSNNQPYNFVRYEHDTGVLAPGGKLLMSGDGLRIWNTFPVTSTQQPNLIVTGAYLNGGDGNGVALAGGRVYALDGNDNKIVAYNALPTNAFQEPDFVVGAPDLCANTLVENFVISNPVPASDGHSLFVSSDFDRKLYVWTSLPNASGAHPNWVYTLPEPPWDNTLVSGTLALAGKRGVYVWTRAPLDGQMPDIVLTNTIGNVTLQQLKGVALDDRYFYLGDDQTGMVYVWSGIPNANSNPIYTLNTGPAIARIESDGRYLTVVSNVQPSTIRLYDVSDLAAPPLVVQSGANFRFNLPGGAITLGDQLLVADTVFSRVMIWDRLTDAVAGQAPSRLLGAATLDDTQPETGRDKLFWPAALSWDGAYLWVGEFKFSERLLRYSPGQDGFLPMVLR